MGVGLNFRSMRQISAEHITLVTKCKYHTGTTLYQKVEMCVTVFLLLL